MNLLQLQLVNNNSNNQLSLCELVQQMADEYDNYPSVRELVCAIEHLETNMEILEQRLQEVKKEVKILISQEQTNKKLSRF